MREKPREFRPGPVSAREWLPLVFLTLLALVGLAAMAINPQKANLAPVTVLLLLVLPGTWIALRLRMPGQPRLRVDGAGLAYKRHGHVRQLAWRELEAITVDDRRQEMRFEPSDGSPPIIVHRTMVSDAGEHFDVLVERYWTTAQGRGRKSWRRATAPAKTITP